MRLSAIAKGTDRPRQIPFVRWLTTPVVNKARFLYASLILVIIFSIISPSHPAVAAATAQKLGPRLSAQLAVSSPNQQISVVINMKNPLDPNRAAVIGAGRTRREKLIRGLQSHADASQMDLRAYLHNPNLGGKVSKITPFWIVDGLSLSATPDVIQALSARADVAQIELEEVIPAPETTTVQTTNNAWDSLGKIGARQLWALGYTGQNVVVASLDTGVEYTHSELVDAWRGGTNSWYDPYGVHAVPADLPFICGTASGHGTETMGVMVGKTVGVAPAARWISAKIFDDNCQATTTAILQSLQWVLDPDNNPTTPDAPQVVNNSWGVLGCDLTLTYRPAIQALLAAGIVPVFSAGNYGPNSGTGAYPATYPESFSVGSTDSLDVAPSFSSRGPNTCGGQGPVIFPQLAAPGFDILTSGLGNTYTYASGTSISAPQVAGAIALLLSASPQGLTVQKQEDTLMNSAIDLGPTGPDNTYGYGRLDIWGAYRWLLPDAQMGFTVSTQSIDETSGVANIAVTRSGGTSFPITVDLNVIGGTAVAGVNYMLPTTQLTFAAKETQKTLQIGLIQDHRPGSDQTLVLALSNPQIGSPGGIQTASINPAASQMTLTIVNRDPWMALLPMVVR